MAFPYDLDESFEDGTKGGFNSSAVDSESKMEIAHYGVITKKLGRFGNAVPEQGAYALHIDMSVGTAVAYQQVTTAAVVAASTGAAIRFGFWMSSDTVMATNDVFDIFQWQSVGPVGEFFISVKKNTATTWQLGASGVTKTLTAVTNLLPDMWHVVELVINTGTGGADGTLALYVDGYQVGTTNSTIVSAALTQARLGVVTTLDAGTTAGHLMFDAVVIDSARVGNLANRYAQRRYATKSTHVALGPGQLEMVDFYASNANDTLTLYDTDRADTTDVSTIVLGPMQATNVYTTLVELLRHPRFFQKGLYAVLGGGTPRAMIVVGDVQDMSAGGIKNIGQRVA